MKIRTLLTAAAILAATIVPTAASADEAAYYELGIGAGVSYECVAGGWNQATVYNIPSGYFMSYFGEASYEFVPHTGIQFTYGTDGLRLMFTPLGELMPEAIVPLPDNCWENVEKVLEAPAPKAELAPAISGIVRSGFGPYPV